MTAIENLLANGSASLALLHGVAVHLSDVCVGDRERMPTTAVRETLSHGSSWELNDGNVVLDGLSHHVPGARPCTSHESDDAGGITFIDHLLIADRSCGRSVDIPERWKRDIRNFVFLSEFFGDGINTISATLNDRDIRFVLEHFTKTIEDVIAIAI